VDAPLLQILVGVARIQPGGWMPEKGRVSWRRHATTSDPAPERTGHPLRGRDNFLPPRQRAWALFHRGTARRGSHGQPQPAGQRALPPTASSLLATIIPFLLRRRARVARRRGARTTLAARERLSLRATATREKLGRRIIHIYVCVCARRARPYREPQQVPKQRMLWHVAQGTLREVGKVDA